MKPTLAGVLQRRQDGGARRGARGCLLLLAALPFGGVLGVVLLVVVIGGASSSTASAVPTQMPGIPKTMLDAYVRAAQRAPTIAPDCRGMRWSIVGGIAAVESNHANGRAVAPNGDITPPILGPPLDGSGVGGNRTPIRNSDGSFARAEGPFQFLSTTWAGAGKDGNDDGRADPHNAFDAALAAAFYLCGTGLRDLTDLTQLREAIYRYNHSQAYVDKVLSHITSYDAIPADAVSSVAATGTAKTVIDAALAQQGKPYAWGGGTAAGPSRGIRDGGVADAHGDFNKIGFDCSGLTLYAYAQAGVALPHSSRSQFNMGTRVPRDAGLAALRPGDLVFYSPSGIHHVGIYLGEGRMVNAPFSGATVRVDVVDLGEYAGGVRLLA